MGAAPRTTPTRSPPVARRSPLWRTRTPCRRSPGARRRSIRRRLNRVDPGRESHRRRTRPRARRPDDPPRARGRRHRRAAGAGEGAGAVHPGRPAGRVGSRGRRDRRDGSGTDAGACSIDRRSGGPYAAPGCSRTVRSKRAAPSRTRPCANSTPRCGRDGCRQRCLRRTRARSPTTVARAQAECPDANATDG